MHLFRFHNETERYDEARTLRSRHSAGRPAKPLRTARAFRLHTMCAFPSSTAASASLTSCFRASCPIPCRPARRIGRRCGRVPSRTRPTSSQPRRRRTPAAADLGRTMIVDPWEKSSPRVPRRRHWRDRSRTHQGRKKEIGLILETAKPLCSRRSTSRRRSSSACSARSRREGGLRRPYFQYSRYEGWSLEKASSSRAFNRAGVGVRAISGEKTAFAYSDEISFGLQDRGAERAPSPPNKPERTKVAVRRTPVPLYRDVIHRKPARGCQGGAAREAGKEMPRARPAHHPVVASLGGEYEVVLDRAPTARSRPTFGRW